MRTPGRMTALGTLALWATAMAWPVAAQDPLHARVSFEDGAAMVRGQADSDWSYATVNTLIMPGDVLWAGETGIVEVEMSGGSYLRLADGSKAEIQGLPPSAAIRGWTGAFYVQRMNRSTGNLVFSTPAADITVSQDSMVRVDVVESGATTVSVRFGEARVATNVGGAVLVTPGKRTWIDPGYLPSAPLPFDRNALDAFDEWNQNRAKYLATGGTLPVATKAPVLGTADLDYYGDWVVVEGTRYWRPTVVREYVPYRSGHWSYVPAVGYTWVGDYPFCYVTSHYGRWNYVDSYGWLWAYSDGWAPAWASTYRVGSNFVWYPVDFYGRPVYSSGATITIGDVRISIGSTSYCPAPTLIGYGYAPVYPATPTLINNGTIINVNVWNIYDSQYRARPPYSPAPGGGSNLPSRDYSPRRVIRGPDTISPGRPGASVLTAQLEDRIGRTQFASVPTTGARALRTPMTESSRHAQMRSVRLDEDAVHTATRSSSAANRDPRTLRAGGGGGEAPSASGAYVPADRAATETRSGRTLRGVPDTATRGAVPEDTRTTRGAETGRAASTTRSASPGAAGAPDTGRSLRTPAGGSASIDRSAATRSGGPTATVPRATSPADRRLVTGTGRDTSVRTPPSAIAAPPTRSVTPQASPGTSRTESTRAGAAPRSVNLGTSRVAPQASESRSIAPSRSTRTPSSTAAPSRTTAPTPRVTAPERTTSPGVRSTPAPTRSEPRFTVPERSVSPGTRTAPPTYTPNRSSSVAPRSSAPPTRSVAPSSPRYTPAPSSAPRSNPSSSRSISPGASSAPRYSAPSLRSAPSPSVRSAPAPSVRSAPSPSVRSAPSTSLRSAPSAPSAPRISAPSRSASPSRQIGGSRSSGQSTRSIGRTDSSSRSRFGASRSPSRGR